MKKEPTHGYCTLCRGAIPKGVQWTLTGLLNRVHSDPDDCLAVLRPRLYNQLVKASPGYKSSHRYTKRDFISKMGEHPALQGGTT